ncbi:MAG: hypothetical protein K2H21_09915 [Muribaculaceae bacterium]|nr:hypothetical protein [Muribaculaceae bacterium]
MGIFLLAFFNRLIIKRAEKLSDVLAERNICINFAYYVGRIDASDDIVVIMAARHNPGNAAQRLAVAPRHN